MYGGGHYKEGVQSIEVVILLMWSLYEGGLNNELVDICAVVHRVEVVTLRRWPM